MSLPATPAGFGFFRRLLDGVFSDVSVEFLAWMALAQ